MSEKNENKSIRSLFTSHIDSLLLMVLALYVIIIFLKGVSVAWFASNDEVSATDISVSVSTPAQIKVTKTSSLTEPDISELVGVEGMIETSPVAESTSDGKMVPGSHGTLTFYLTYITEQSGAQYEASLTTDIFNDVLYNDEDRNITEGYSHAYEDRLDQALMFIRTHMAFFTDYNDNTDSYSGYITENDPMKILLNAGEPKKVTLYWVWIEDFTALQRNGDLVDSFCDFPETWCYKADGDFTELVDSIDNLSSEQSSVLNTCYNSADLIIARVLRKITFFISVA